MTLLSRLLVCVGAACLSLQPATCVGAACLSLQPAAVAQTVSKTVSMPLNAFNVSNSTLNLTIHGDDIMVPSLKDAPLNSESLRGILPYQGSPEAKKVEQALLNSPTPLTLGSGFVYFYIAANLAFDRIFSNLMLYDRDVALEGFPKVDGKIYLNLRDIANFSPINSAVLNIEIFFDQDEFCKQSGSLELHSNNAFWDSSQNRIGIYFNPRLFRYIRKQTEIGQRRYDEIAYAIQQYVDRVGIGLFAHEIIHFVQNQSNSNAAASPFMAEALALFLEDNIYLREERSIIADALMSRGLSLKPWLPPCMDLMKITPPFSARSLLVAADAEAAYYRGAFALAPLINKDALGFYGQDDKILRMEYALLPAFTNFLIAMNRDEFTRRFSPLLTSGALVDARGLDDGFGAFLKRMDERFTSGGDEQYRYLVRVQTYCLNNFDYASASFAALAMIALRPHDGLGYVYLGDVFFNSINPFIALDYYVMAQQQLPADPRPSFIRILTLSRLGDAYYELGDKELATTKFKELDVIDPDAVPMITESMILYRDKLRLIFYQIADNQKRKPEEITPLLADLYAHAFLGGACSSDADQAAKDEVLRLIDANQLEAAKGVLHAQFEMTKAAMTTELAERNWTELQSERRKLCPHLAPPTP